MISSSSQRSGDLCGPEEDGLRIAAMRRLHSSGYSALRRLRCEVAEGGVIVHGVVASYFLKQMAQTLIQQLDSIQGVTNLVEVSMAGRGGDRDE